MRLEHLNKKAIAIMVASGFTESEFIEIHRTMMVSGAKLKLVSREAGVTSAWNVSSWGMSYPVDATLSNALAIDYDGLIIPSGRRHIKILKNEAHARRLLCAFLRENTPVMIMGEGLEMLDNIKIETLQQHGIEHCDEEKIFVQGSLLKVRDKTLVGSALSAFNSVVGSKLDKYHAA